MLQNPDIKNMCECAGVRPSPVRSLVIRELDAAVGPMSAQDLETALQTVDRSSITRTLALFSERGLVHAVDDGSGSVKYELCRAHDHEHHDDLHPHFRCTSCGTTYCLDSAPIPAVPLPDGFLFHSANYVIKGLCPKCNR